jgi:phosphopantetheine adenylyltransferase/dephospho-CoA kinase
MKMVFAFSCHLWQITAKKWSTKLKIICMTGGLASGKTTASEFLQSRGAEIIDADKLGHRAYDPGTQAYLKVIEAFGEDIVADDHQIDRRALGGKVFGKPEELKRLTDIVWPEIRRLAELEIAGYDATYPDGVVVLEAAVLFEAGWEDIGDEIWVLAVDREVAVARAMARDNADRTAVESRIDSQLSNEERIARATTVIYNNGDQEGMIEQLEAEWLRVSQG